MRELCAELSQLIGPRLRVEAAGGRSIMTTLDAGTGGTHFTFVAPLPRVTAAADLRATVRNVVAALHTDATTAPFAGTTDLGPREPDIRPDAAETFVITFYDLEGAPLRPLSIYMRTE